MMSAPFSNPSLSDSDITAQAGFLRRGFLVRETRPEPPKGPRLLDRVRQAVRARHYSPSTEKAYTGWIKRFMFIFFGCGSFRTSIFCLLVTSYLNCTARPVPVLHEV